MTQNARYGHRTGDRECPLIQSGNLKLEAERQGTFITPPSLLTSLMYQSL
jgi:hypothetical protein